MSNGDRVELVYLMGVMPRCGTNHLFDLLDAHPEIEECPSPVGEDFLITCLPALDTFVDAAKQRWDKLYKGSSAKALDILRRAAWAGVERDFQIREPNDGIKWVIARTPSVEHLDRLRDVSDAKVIVIVRDGRSVVESGMRSFGWIFEEAIRLYAEATSELLNAKEASENILVVHFEDLLSDRSTVVASILDFIGAPRDVYNFDFEPLVRGSSDMFAKGVFWEGTKKTEAFNPTNRWDDWTNAQHQRFAAVAGDASRQLGYDIATVRTSAAGAIKGAVVARGVGAARVVANKILPRDLRHRMMWRRGEHYRSQ